MPQEVGAHKLCKSLMTPPCSWFLTADHKEPPTQCAEPFCEIVKTRNELAKKQGYANYYDMKVQAAEGFDQRRLFEMLDELESMTRDLATRARASLAAANGPESLEVCGDTIFTSCCCPRVSISRCSSNHHSCSNNTTHVSFSSPGTSAMP